MMSLDEAIKHCEEKSDCTECGMEHRQLAEWLLELKKYKDLEKQGRLLAGWIPVRERLPEDDSYILVSFENFSVADIARYETDEDGGAFYPGDEDKSFVSFGLFVNAWMPLPEPYRPEK